MITKAAVSGRAHCDEERTYANRKYSKSSSSSSSAIREDEDSDESDDNDDDDEVEVVVQQRKKGRTEPAPDFESATTTLLVSLAESIKEDTAERRQRRLGA